ncbi:MULTISPECIES: site-specific DNA-methyltransferase [unclassified Synechocystis]|uniref:DNA-methyltransferase n=1 Tax=unclassified Synechocystis TaxID=2640012 RepID=UPI00040EE597|nr:MULTISPECIES: site-specific DNA-methyltransferase [unclassified Synechocystis]MCT0254428.1 site-specific DNA-methyltransferase [Synechocystis sp. CS-94]
MSEDNSRKIANKNHNSYILEGIDKHQSTQLAPSALLRPLPELLKEQLDSQFRLVKEELESYLGKPFFADKGFILYKGDLTRLLSDLSKSSLKVDLTVTSPPYNIGKEYETPMSIDEYVEWCSDWMNQLHKVTKSNGSFWLNLGYLEVPEKGLCIPIPYLLWDKSYFYLLQEVVWKYGAGVSTKSRLSPRNEKWLFYVKNSQKYTFNLDDIRDPNVKYPNQKKNGKYRCNPLGKNPSDVWDFPKVTTGNKRSSKERTDHPAQFPLGVVERIIKASSNNTDIILDPFAGSCSTGIASIGLGRIFLGFELRQDYCEIAVARFHEFTKQRQEFFEQKELF